VGVDGFVGGAGVVAAGGDPNVGVVEVEPHVGVALFVDHHDAFHGLGQRLHVEAGVGGVVGGDQLAPGGELAGE
jgi:hypothetical protein